MVLGADGLWSGDVCYGGGMKIPNRRSAHYKKQSAFAGSDRELRGKILRSTLCRNKEKIECAQNSLRIGRPRERFEKVVGGLEKEDLLLEKEIIFVLNNNHAAEILLKQRRSCARLCWARCRFLRLPQRRAASRHNRRHSIMARGCRFGRRTAGEQQIAVNLDSLNEISPFSYEIVDDAGPYRMILRSASGAWNGLVLRRPLRRHQNHSDDRVV